MKPPVSGKLKPKRRWRNATKNRLQSTGGDYQLLPARLPYAKRIGEQIYTVGEATIYVWGSRLVRSSHGRRFQYRVPLRQPSTNDSTQSRLEELDSAPDNTSSVEEAGFPLSPSSRSHQVTLGSLPSEGLEATEIPEPTNAQQDILPLSLASGEGVNQSLTAIGRQQLFDRLMEQFWTHFNVEFTTYGNNTSKHSSEVLPQGLLTPPQSTSSMPSTASVGGQNGEHTPGGDDDDPNIPRKRKNVSGAGVCSQHFRFACPYRKHDPHKYNVMEWASCGLTPHNTIARVKAHLYQCHRILQCPRCMSVFNTEVEQQRHVSHETVCERSSTPVVDGITEDIERQLRCRKTRFPGQSEESRWGDIYRILFPSEPVPAPYFEPPSEKRSTSDPYDRALEDYETYVRLQLPIFFRSALETAISNEAQPIEERLRLGMTDILQQAQERVFAQYHTAHSQPAPFPSSPSHLTNSLTTGQTDKTSVSELGLPGPANHVISGSVSGLEIDFVDFDNEVFECPMTEYADSGYGSVSPSVLHEHIDEDASVSKRFIPWSYGPGDIQDAIYPRHVAIVNIPRRRAPLSPETANKLDRVMKGFWLTIFDKDWLHSFRKHGHASAPRRGGKGTQTSKSSNSSKSKNNQRGRKKTRLSASDEEEEEEGSKEVMLDPDDDEDPDLDLGFACPYRKYSPNKYNVTDWAPCALTSRPTIARIKDHLYRYHFVFQCQRCNGIYDTEPLLNDHINAAQACDVVESQQGGKNGINRSLKDLIASRKRLFPGQSERKKWEHIYQLIFPGEPLPISPYWDDPELQERLFVDRYNEYLLQELPQTVRRDLERLVGNDSNPSERRILEQAVSLLPAALGILWHTFRGTFDPNPDRDDIVVHPSARTSTSTIEPSILGMSQEVERTATVIQPAVSLLQAQPIPAAQNRTSHVPSSSDSAYFSGDSNAGEGSSGLNLGDVNGNKGVEDNEKCDASRQSTILVNDPEAENQFRPSNQGWQAPGIGPGLDTEDRTSVLPQLEIARESRSEQASLQSGQILPDNPPQFAGQDLTPIGCDSFDWEAFMASSEQIEGSESLLEKLHEQ
ncbi:uncharacterized protein PAC_15498 [Phialocephala subalpina]|uniref:C2H2-type domain-containing protein n=1 Tax=Phialocephala subalpina TaxID=576137 RepID=A0A1L7XKQ2_9HELO|nr:uncharacterized protein PAC_15498 [Phialocephala subalpina]